MKRPAYIPANYDRIAVVGSLSELFNARFGPANCILYPRDLTGDFNALAQHLERQKFSFKDNSAQISARELRRLKFPDAATEAAAQVILNDLDALDANLRILKFRQASLRIVKAAGYNSLDDEVYGFHADTDCHGRILCCYTEPVTEGIRNEDAVFIEDTSFNSKPGVVPFRFKTGDIWKQGGLGPALNWWEPARPRPDGIPPFVHRAPKVKPGDPPRLLLVAD